MIKQTNTTKSTAKIARKRQSAKSIDSYGARCGLDECGLPIDGQSWLTITWESGKVSRIGYCSDAHLRIAEDYLRRVAPEKEAPEKEGRDQTRD